MNADTTAGTVPTTSPPIRWRPQPIRLAERHPVNKPLIVHAQKIVAGVVIRESITFHATHHDAIAKGREFSSGGWDRVVITAHDLDGEGITI